ncbi:riboflavin synthase [bacterium]|nr:riboflavin synthase [bacterium]
MFTGIIAGTLIVADVTDIAHGRRVRLAFPGAINRLNTGDSIALNGVCTTAIDITDNGFSIELLAETLKKTSFDRVKSGAILNWELSATPTTALGGHLVYGHVDEVGTIVSIRANGTFNVVEVRYSAQFQPFLIRKGSICINGISLTVVDVTPTTFTCHLIPHTSAHTVIHTQKSGDMVNLEYDIVAKYLYNFSRENTDTSLRDTLNKAGFL